MTELLNYIVVFIASLATIIALGLMAGFSPTLYIAQVAVASKSKNNSYTIAIMAGVLGAILALIMLFQTVHLETLITIIDTTVHAVIVSVVFNILVGTALIIAGFRYIHRHELPAPKKLSSKQTSGIIGLFGLGFARTFISISGITATYIAGNVIADVSTGMFERFIYTIIFLISILVPFAVIVIITRRKPERLELLTNDIRNLLQRFNYQLVVGGAAIIFGASITIFNIMMALLY